MPIKPRALLLGMSLIVLSGRMPLVAQVPRPGPATPRVASRTTQSADPTKSASVTFGMLQLLAQPDSAAMVSVMKQEGLVPMSDMKSVWHLASPDGEVRVGLMPELDDGHYMWMVYFPASRRPLSDATLSWMYRTATGYSFEDGDGVSLEYLGRTDLPYQGSSTRSILVDLLSSTMVRQKVWFVWKKKL